MPDTRSPVRSVRTEFLRALFLFAPDNHYIEFRCLNGKPRETKILHISVSHLRTHEPPHDWIDLLNEQGYNIYFSACPRVSRIGTGAEDVKFSLAVWADFDNGYPDPWPETLPKPSIIYSSSEGRFQAWWLLDRPCSDLNRIERVNRSIALALGSDPKVFDRARILRLPETRNTKPEHPDKPIARMWYDGYQDRYNLDTLEALLPSAPANPTRAQRQGANRGNGGKFDPHSGTPLPSDLQKDLAKRLTSIGLTPSHDGRLSGPCPFEGHNPGSKDTNFLVSPITGQWWCFGANHPGASAGKISVSGGVNSLLPRIGMAVPDQSDWLPPVEALADEEPSTKAVMSSYDRTRVYPQEGTTTLVQPQRDISTSGRAPRGAVRDITEDSEGEPADLNSALDGAGSPSVVGVSAEEQRRREGLIHGESEACLPLPGGIPSLKRVSKVRVANGYEEGKSEYLFSNTWQNPVNAMGHRRCLYKHLRLRTWDWPEMYYHEIAADDWGEKRRASLERRVKHRGGLWFGVNNLATRHMVAVFTSVSIDGAELLEADRIQAEIATSVADIEPPAHMEKRQRFKPYWCSRALAVQRPKGTGEWEVIGRQEVQCPIEEFIPIVERAAAKNGIVVEWRTGTRRPEVYGPQMYFRATVEARQRAIAEHPDGEHQLYIRFIRDCGDGLTKKAWEDLTGQKQEDRFPKKRGRREAGRPA